MGSIALGERFPKPAQVGFEPAHHDRLEIASGNRDAAGEALRVEHLEQSGKAVGVPVVRGRGEEQAMLEALCELSNGARQLARDGIPCPACRGGVVRLVENEQRARAKFAQNVAQARGVGLIDQQRVRDEAMNIRASPRSSTSWTANTSSCRADP
jgi:hypothetical protein